MKISLKKRYSAGKWQLAFNYPAVLLDAEGKHLADFYAPDKNAETKQANALLASVAPDMAEELWKLLRQELRGWCWYEKEEGDTIFLKPCPHNLTEMLRTIHWFNLLHRANCLHVENEGVGS